MSCWRHARSFIIIYSPKVQIFVFNFCNCKHSNTPLKAPARLLRNSTIRCKQPKRLCKCRSKDPVMNLLFVLPYILHIMFTVNVLFVQLPLHPYSALTAAGGFEFAHPLHHRGAFHVSEWDSGSGECECASCACTQSREIINCTMLSNTWE